MTLIVDVKAIFSENLNSAGMIDLIFTVANDEISTFQSLSIYHPVIIGALDIPNNTFPTIEAAIANWGPGDAATIVADLNTRSSNVYVLRDVITHMSKGVNDYMHTKFDKPNGTTNQYIRGDGSLATLPTASTRTTSTLSLSLVGTGATGTQIDASKDSTVKLCVSTSATATIAGAATSKIELKICATNNATEGSWTTVATQQTDQSVSLAIALQSVTAQKGQLFADLPAGWYVKLVNSGTGTHSESFVSGQKTIYG